MNELLSKIVLILLDLGATSLAIATAYILRSIFNWDEADIAPPETYLLFLPIYGVVLLLFVYEGIYTRRYDFWHESRMVLKALALSLIIVMAFLALTKSAEEYSRFIILLAFAEMAFFIPLFKNIGKKTMFRFGLWRRAAVVYGEDRQMPQELFRNPYLGYTRAANGEAKTIFIHSGSESPEALQKIIAAELEKQHEVIFTPLIDAYDLTQSDIYALFNTRNNLILFQNRLKNRYRTGLKRLSDLLLALLLLPLLLPLLGVIALVIKAETPSGAVLFRQERIGRRHRIFHCYKFRTMQEKGTALLEAYLRDHPEEAEYYARYRKYRNDPRITPVGGWLRRLSLDELPQVFNVLKGEMSFVGPRPYMLDEKGLMDERMETIVSVLPGITGIWQISGRSNVTFADRVGMDLWYIRNWSLWLDVVILLKTIKTVLLKEGAQ